MTGITLDREDLFYWSPTLRRSNECLKRCILVDLGLSKEEIDTKIKKIIDENNITYIYTGMTSKLLEIEPLNKYGLPIIFGTGDVWGRLWSNQLKEIIDYHNVQGIVVNNKCEISAYKEYFDREFNYHWFPWSVDTTKLYDYKLEKIYDVIFSGKLSNYQFRKYLYFNLLYRSGLGVLKFKHHIPIKYESSNESVPPLEDYAKNINSSWIGIGGCIQSKDTSYYKGHFIGNTFKKTLEMPACGTALLNCHWGDEDALGFKDGDNCILFNTLEEAFEKIEYYLDDKELLAKITKQGYDLVQNNYDDIKVCDNFFKEIENTYE
jgi:hypothetical protein